MGFRVKEESWSWEICKVSVDENDSKEQSILIEEVESRDKFWSDDKEGKGEKSQVDIFALRKTENSDPLW